MLRMPVATLRNWERRYRLTQAALSAGGQRLYSAQDVRRLTLIRQLIELGHAIGALAPLDMAQLQQVAATHATALATTQPAGHAAAANKTAARPPRLLVIGEALAVRLRSPALLHQLGQTVELLGPFDSAEQAAAAAVDGTAVDAVLAQVPQLHADWRAAFDAAAPAFSAVPKAVLYSFATEAACNALAGDGVQLLREPQPDVVVAQWLRGLLATREMAPAAASAPPPPRRWSVAALADFARLSSTVACECPRHLAELLVQLSHFEAYSIDCEHRNAADAELHAHLAAVAGRARASFEAALEHLALHEGLLLPR
ncbi:MAG: MerR family transcriptional regulator [Rubrivivax sp.]|nr:MAG: MerR family transcriptional regulator [Rubrivivax sp.]